MQSSFPLFAPAHGGQDDFDLSEIFAEYFISEFDDPLNAYTASMANYSGGFVPSNAVAGAHASSSTLHPFGLVTTTAPTTGGLVTTPAAIASSGGHGGAVVSLPTGGIRTAFHSGSAPSASNAFLVNSSSAAADQLAKKQKLDEQILLQHQQQQQQQLLLAHPGMMLSAVSTAQDHAAIVAQQQQQAQGMVGVDKSAVTLPVGVGIRLGSVGGVSGGIPQTAVVGSGQQMAQVPAAFAAPPSSASSSIAGGQFYGGGGSFGGGGGGGGSADYAMAERRQRNREHAKRSRVRKKFMLESLQGEVKDLQRENQRLRLLVQAHIPENALQIISECCAPNPLFDDEALGMGGGSSGEGGNMKDPSFVGADFTLMQSLTMGQQCFVLSDPKLPDNPIVFASPSFYKLTGYTSKEVLGRNCRFLQGPGTNPQAVDVIRKAIATGSDATVCLLNYKADGTPFWNQFFMAALRDSDNNIVNYVGVQTLVEPDSGANILEERVNAVLPLKGKDDDDDDDDDE